MRPSLPGQPESPVLPPPAPEVLFGDGFYEEEREDAGTFRWMQPHAVLHIPPDVSDRFLEFGVLSEYRDLTQTLTISAGATDVSYPLAAGWGPLSIPLLAEATIVTLTVNKAFPREYHPPDSRQLAVRLRSVRVHGDAARHAALLRQYDNLVLNQREIADGRTVLQSTPPNLGIDLHGACNVKPPCVYCEWDGSKAMEGEHASVPFTRDTLRDWGAFFDNSTTLINCSIGEPFMMKNLDELLDVFRAEGKVLQMTTNGQILTDRNIQKLLGLPIDLYVSLDAATAETYAKLRNDRFESLLRNLRRLIEAKGGRGGLPRVHVVFMPMRCNLHELDAFVRLAADLQADRLVLRPLNYSETTTLDWQRSGYHFDYNQELLSFDDLVRASARAAALCERLHVELADQMDFGGSMRETFGEAFEAGVEDVATDVADAEPATDPVSAPLPAAALVALDAGGAVAVALANPSAVEAEPAPVIARNDASAGADVTSLPTALPSLGGEHEPACLEPWKSMYILRRGVLPCCYGGALAPMEEYRTVWNSPKMQAIRTALLRGKLHSYCLEAVSCPIVRKAQETRRLPMHQRAILRGRHLWNPINRAFGGWPNRFVYHPLKRTARRVRRAATDPVYVSRKIVSRLTGRPPQA
ncbi:MAG TPA: radical SAM/SPASM domain-containing protein [Vicinamibacterales bacterium]|jgi:pyruvate-formate lyase-activating enzyme|nr:radical SAM/SPASM domain-containing protein [Vicinamibacterales bacterium]